MDNFLNRILFKLYKQDVIEFIKRKLKLNKEQIVVDSFLSELSLSSGNSEKAINLAEIHFKQNKEPFYKACFFMIMQILNSPLEKSIKFDIENVNYLFLPLMIRITDSFGRFDLGYNLTSEYFKKLESKALNVRSKRREKVRVLLHWQIFGSEFFVSNHLDVDFKVPFYLKNVHRNITSQYAKDLKEYNEVDLAIYDKINNRTIAVLAPGILDFSEELVSELREFDEIIPLTYTYGHYKDFPLPIRISYYNGENSYRLLKDLDFNNGIRLDFYCLKVNLPSNLKGSRQIHRDSFKWILGSPNMIQVTLHDILCQLPLKVKVFGMNFFLSDQPYHKEYRSNLTVNSLASHNMASNFLYIDNLFQQGKIDLDYDAVTIINKGLKQYLLDMTNQYKLIF